MHALVSPSTARRWLRCGALAALPLLVALLAAALVVARDARAAGREIEAAERDLHGVLHDGDLLSLSHTRVEQAERRLDEAAARLRRDRLLLTPAFPLLHVAGWLPGVGRPLTEVPDLLALGEAVARGGASLARGVDPLLAETDPAAPVATAGDPPGARLVAALDAGAAALRAGDRDLRRAAALRAGLHPLRYQGPFAPLRRQIARFDESLGPAVRQADALATLPAAAHSLLGFDGPRTYVVLGQDAAEIRPTGGFIGSAGLLTLDRGRLVFQEYRSSYDFDAPGVAPLPPPEPLRRYLGIGVWLLRDANWSPDFPTSARQILDFVQRDTGIEADGVIAFDSFAVSGLLAALGPLDVAGFAQPVTAENWFDLTTQALLIGPDSLLNRLRNANAAKGAGLSAVLNAALSRAQSARGHDQIAVVDALRQAGRGGHLQLYLSDARPAAWARLVGVDGAMTPPPGDSVAAIDANLGYSKVGPYIARSLQYEVWLRPDATPARAELTLHYRNEVTEALLQQPVKRLDGARWLPAEGRLAPTPGLFGNYLRVWAPDGSALDNAAGLAEEPTIGEEAGYRVFGAFLPLEPQAEQTLVFRYRPAVVAPARGLYRLTLFKQPGIDHLPAQVTVHLPPGRSATDLSSGGHQEGDAVRYELDLTATAKIGLRLVGGTAP